MPIIVQLSGFTPWTTMVDETAPLVPECPRPIIEKALREACREFFSTSRCWRVYGETLLTTVAAQSSYQFNSAANAELLDVMACWDGSREVDAALPGDSDNAYPGQLDNTGNMPWYSQSWRSPYQIEVSDNGSSLELSPSPSSSGTVLKGSVSYTLAMNATGIPSWVYNEHQYALTCGAAARLVVQPKKPWTDRESYAMHRKMFERAISEASNKAGPVRRNAMRTIPV